MNVDMKRASLASILYVIQGSRIITDQKKNMTDKPINTCPITNTILCNNLWMHEREKLGQDRGGGGEKKIL